MTTDKYRKGLQREVVSMRRKGHTEAEIAKALGVDRNFVQTALAEAVMPDYRQLWEPDYGDANETGGY